MRRPPSAVPRALALALSTALARGPLAAQPPAPRIVVTPGPALLAGDSAGVRVTGLPPHAEVELTAERLVGAPGRRAVWASRARYAADGAGVVDLARSAPLGGSSYAGADAAGLFWSMTPEPGDTAGRRPGEVRLAARVANREVARAAVLLRASDPAVRVDSVPGFPGAVFAVPPAAPGTPPRRLPTLVVLGGSEGGASTARSMAPRLASRGYAVLGLPYYAPAWGGPSEFPTLPAGFVDIPVDRLDSARAWLAGRPEVDSSRMGIYGVSKGAEFALLAAARSLWVRAVVAVAPTDVVWEGWGPGAGTGRASSFAVGGRALPFVPYAGMDSVQARIARGEAVGIRVAHDAGRRAHPAAAAAARIPVERYGGALLVIGGDADQVWASGPMARAIAARRARAGRRTTLLAFPAAGHALSGDGWGPTTGYGPGLGGKPAGNARAQREAWGTTLRFLARELGGQGTAGR